jgi:acetyl esterase/lipase
VSYKSTPDGDINLEIFYPEAASDSPRVVLLHYHGVLLVVGDRFSFFPYWLVRACASRGWIFISPEYRLMPESTAHKSLEDASDAYQWVLSILPQELGCELGTVLMAGTSAGAYLALATAACNQVQPGALLLIYDMLDATGTHTGPPVRDCLASDLLSTRVPS